MDKIEKIDKLIKHKRFEGAKKALLRLYNENEKNFDILDKLGTVEFELTNYKDAFIYLKKAHEINPSYKSCAKLGECLFKLKDYNNAQTYLINSILEKYSDDTARILEKALFEKPDDSVMLGLKIMMHRHHPKDIYILRDITNFASQLKEYDIAVEAYETLLKLCPDDYVAWNNLGLIYEENGQWVKARDCYKKSLSSRDFFSPNFNLGIISRKLHNFDDAIMYLKKAIVQNPTSPQPKYSLAMSYLVKKDFENGYPLYAAHMSKIMPDFYKNEWDGKEKHTDKTLCIFGTGGLGDMIMFARYFEYLKWHFKKLYLIVPKTLVEIFKTSFPYIEIIDSTNIFTDYDYAITPMHILQYFNLDFNKIVPHTDSYLTVRKDLIEQYKEKFFNHDKLKIGIYWHGHHETTRTFFNRSMNINVFENIFEKYKDTAIFYSIQKDEACCDVQQYPFVVDLSEHISSFEDTAAILKNIDLLITIDSSPVHMAGALGVPTFLIIPYASEWRWFINDFDCIWYDTVKIFRQNKEGDWASAMKKAEVKLDEILKQ